MLPRRIPGFTLIETMLYIAFVGMILTSVVLLATTAFRVRSTVRASLVVQENARFAASRIRSLVTEASDITSPASGATSTTLILSTAVPAENPTTITLTNGVITLTQGAGAATALTSNEVNVSNLTFTRLGGTIPSVRMSLTGTLRNAAAPTPSFTATSTASVRK